MSTALIAIKESDTKNDKNESNNISCLLYKLNPNYDLVDALPYVDSYTDALKNEVNKLIELEMCECPPRDYLEFCPAPFTPLLDAAYNIKTCSDSTVLPPAEPCENVKANNDIENEQEKITFAWQNSLQSLIQNKPLKKLDMSRYSIPPPSDQNSTDIGEWKQATENAKAQAESSSIRVINLELALKHAQPAWLQHLEQLQGYERVWKKRSTEIASSIEAINKQRKLSQVTGGNELRSLARDYDTQTERNKQILPIIYQLQQEIEQLSDVLD